MNNLFSQESSEEEILTVFHERVCTRYTGCYAYQKPFYREASLVALSIDTLLLDFVNFLFEERLLLCCEIHDYLRQKPLSLAQEMTSSIQAAMTHDRLPLAMRLIRQLYELLLQGMLINTHSGSYPAYKNQVIDELKVKRDTYFNYLLNAHSPEYFSDSLTEKNNYYTWLEPSLGGDGSSLRNIARSMGIDKKYENLYRFTSHFAHCSQREIESDLTAGHLNGWAMEQNPESIFPEAITIYTLKQIPELVKEYLPTMDLPQKYIERFSRMWDLIQSLNYDDCYREVSHSPICQDRNIFSSLMTCVESPFSSSEIMRDHFKKHYIRDSQERIREDWLNYSPKLCMNSIFEMYKDLLEVLSTMENSSVLNGLFSVCFTKFSDLHLLLMQDNIFAFMANIRIFHEFSIKISYALEHSDSKNDYLGKFLDELDLQDENFTRDLERALIRDSQEVLLGRELTVRELKELASSEELRRKKLERNRWTGLPKGERSIQDLARRVECGKFFECTRWYAEFFTHSTVSSSFQSDLHPEDLTQISRYELLRIILDIASLLTNVTNLLFLGMDRRKALIEYIRGGINTWEGALDNMLEPCRTGS